MKKYKLLVRLFKLFLNLSLFIAVKLLPHLGEGPYGPRKSRKEAKYLMRNWIESNDTGEWF